MSGKRAGGRAAGEHAGGQSVKQAGGQSGTWTDGQTHRPAGGSDWQAGRQKGRRVGRQAEGRRAGGQAECCPTAAASLASLSAPGGSCCGPCRCTCSSKQSGRKTGGPEAGGSISLHAWPLCPPAGVPRAARQAPGPYTQAPPQPPPSHQPPTPAPTLRPAPLPAPASLGLTCGTPHS